MPSRSIWTSLGFAAALAVLVTGAAPRAADAYTWPLLPHCQSLAFFPDPMTPDHDIWVLLSYSNSTEYWKLVQARVVDSVSVEVTVHDSTASGDSTTWRGWSTDPLVLGRLRPGVHSLHVRAIVERTSGATTIEDADEPFEVVASAPPPPPPVDSTTYGLPGYVELDPSNPQPGQDVAVVAGGRLPFSCGTVTQAGLVDSMQLAITFRPDSGCADTTSAWSHRFDLGPLPAGRYWYQIVITLDDGVHPAPFRWPFTFVVGDPPPPPPSPPPGDSLVTALSPSRPNPFHDETRFSVSVLAPTHADVGIFDLGGRRVATVFRGELPGGTSELAWDGRTSNGRFAPGGIYFYRLTLPNRVVSRRVVLLGRP